jgi:hypothetical protein
MSLDNQVAVRAGPKENRAHPRNRSLKSAKIVFNNRWSVIDCKVRDMSKTGVRLDLAAGTQMPEEFELELLPERKTRHARLVWRKGNLAGVELAST